MNDETIMTEKQLHAAGALTDDASSLFDLFDSNIFIQPEDDKHVFQKYTYGRQ